MEKLKQLLESVTPNLTKEELYIRFPEMAELIMKNYVIKSRGEIFYLNELEFYYFDPKYDDKRLGKGKSRITYERNAPAGAWYIHRYGVDLTFMSVIDEKNVEESFGGGILIRSIENSETHEAITGPVNCVDYLWDEAVDAFTPTAPNPMMIRVEERIIELNDASTRIVVDKADKWKSNWRFTVKDKKVSR